jgi:hypothetical protein
MECPSHAVHYARTADGVSVSLGPSARMDRDVVLSLAPAGHAEHNPCGTQPTAVLSVAADPVLGGTTALAAFSVPRTSARRPVALKLLVDGSGSMMGDSIHSARQALDAIAQALDERDEISFSRFGSDTEVALYPKACTEEAALQLRRQIRETQATLGGTEMAQALLQTLALRRGPLARLGVGASTDGSDVLLITDGEVWDVDETIDAARDSGLGLKSPWLGTALISRRVPAIAYDTLDASDSLRLSPAPAIFSTGCGFQTSNFSAPRSPTMMVAALVLADTTLGITEASMTRKPCTPRTFRSGSTTARSSVPIRQVLVGWNTVPPCPRAKASRSIEPGSFSSTHRPAKLFCW